MIPNQKHLAIVISTFAIFFTLTSCDPETQDEFRRNLLAQLGWDSTFIQKDQNEVERDVNLDENIDNNSFPSSYSIDNRMPPVGDQGDYGTCVAWAAGYYQRTYLFAQDNNLTKASLGSASSQFSPKDLFYAIDRRYKGTNCNGSSFDAAFEVMQARGVAKMSDVPYTNLGNCSGNADSWNNLARDFKIRNYRQIKIDERTFKSHLTQNRAIVIGAKLGNNFMEWNSSAVLTTDNDTYQGQHAYHALVIVGYDDNRRAFRVINSWNTWWGDQGYVWIGYNHMISKFCIAAYVATTNATNISSTNGQVSDQSARSGMDLQASYLTDEDSVGTNGQIRNITYDVYNRGTQSIPATLDWSVIYLWYNAFDADKFGILLHDYYSNDLGTSGENGEWTSSTRVNESNPTPRGSSGNWWNFVDIPAKRSIAQAVYGTEIFEWEYTMPNNLPDGYYYFALWADPFNKVQEEDEDNNYLFYTDENGGPVEVKNGRIVTAPMTNARRGNQQISLKNVTEKSPNTYTREELLFLMRKSISNGRLETILKTNKLKKKKK